MGRNGDAVHERCKIIHRSDRKIFTIIIFKRKVKLLMFIAVLGRNVVPV